MFVPGRALIHLLEAHVCVQDEHGDETSINQRQRRASGEGDGGQRDECDGDRSVEQLVMPVLETYQLLHAPMSHLSKLQW